MNNKILKSLRHTMLSTVAAAIVSIGFTACSDEMTLTKNSSAPADGYKVCIPASIGGGETRAIAYNNETGGYDATFETTDNIYVYDVNQKAMSNNALTPDANGKQANLVGHLTFSAWDEATQSPVTVTPAVGDELMLLYKAVNFEYSNDGTTKWYQDHEPDYALATVTITAVNNGSFTTSAATFQNYQSIFKINFTGIASDVKIKEMAISSDMRKLVSTCYAYSEHPDGFGNVIYKYQGEGTDQHELTFFLRFVANPTNPDGSRGDVLTFKAIGSDGHVYSGTKTISADLENGKYYTADVAMTDYGLGMTVTNNTTGELLDISNYIGLDTRDYSYTATNNGYGTCIEWYGGDQELILKDLNMYNSNDGAIAVKCNEADPTNIIVHNLVLEGVNTLNVTGHTSLTVQYNCSLKISSRSSGKLILKADDMGLNLWDNGTVLTIESGEVTVDGRFGIGTNSSCVITNSGKLRVLTQKNYSSEGIKAGSGYVLQTATEGDYTVYTVTAAPAYEDPKALNTVTTADIGKIIGSDGKVHVPHWDLPKGVSPVGVITRISSTGHGLAIGSEPIIIKKEHESGWVEPFQYFSWDNSAEANDGKTATQIFDDWKANNSVSFGTWRFATAADWQQMVLSCRIDGDATEVSEEMVAEGLVTQLKQTAIFQGSLDCWTGEPSEEESGRWTSIYFDNSYWDEANQEPYSGPYKLLFSRWNDPGNSHNILPVLEF